MKRRLAALTAAVTFPLLAAGLAGCGADDDREVVYIEEDDDDEGWGEDDD